MPIKEESDKSILLRWISLYSVFYLFCLFFFTFLFYLFADMFNHKAFELAPFIGDYFNSWAISVHEMIKYDQSILTAFVNSIRFFSGSYIIIFLISLLLPLLKISIKYHFISNPFVKIALKGFYLIVIVLSFLPFVFTGSLILFNNNLSFLNILVVVFGIGILNSILHQMEIKFEDDFINEGFVDYMDIEGYSFLTISYMITRNNISFLINLLSKNLSIFISISIFIEMTIRGNAGLGPSLLRNIEILFNRPSEFYMALGNIFILFLFILFISFIMQIFSFIICFNFDNKYAKTIKNSLQRITIKRKES
jgi:hypothetical protein